MNNEQSCIEVENVHFGYRQSPILENVSFSVACGDYLGVIGPNGGGKTTLLKLILGLLEPTFGVVRVLGRTVGELSDRSELGYVPQSVSQTEFYFPATVREVVASGRTVKAGLFHRLGRGDYDAVKRAMDIADVARYQHHLIGDLSGGERQRVFIARALAAEPKILILDEPSAGVDIPSQEKFYRFLKTLNEDMKMTIIFVSHDIDIVAREAKTVLCLNRGLVCHGTPEDSINDEYMQKLYGRNVKVIHKH